MDVDLLNGRGLQSPIFGRAGGWGESEDGIATLVSRVVGTSNRIMLMNMKKKKNCSCHLFKPHLYNIQTNIFTNCLTLDTTLLIQSWHNLCGDKYPFNLQQLRTNFIFRYSETFSIPLMYFHRWHSRDFGRLLKIGPRYMLLVNNFVQTNKQLPPHSLA